MRRLGPTRRPVSDSLIERVPVLLWEWRAERFDHNLSLDDMQAACCLMQDAVWLIDMLRGGVSELAEAQKSCCVLHKLLVHHVGS